MQVSVIITTKNEERHIQNCLDSIKQQSFQAQEIEIVVVDNNSTDQTKEIAQRYTDKVFNWGPERSAQRNFGVEKATGEYVLYLDADMTLSESVIFESVEMLKKNGELVALYVSEIVAGENFWSQVRRHERSFYDGTVIDAARFVRKEAFLQVGGFDETLTGPEDWDFDKKLRQIGKISLIQAPIFHNEAEFDLKKYLSKKNYYAQNFARYIAKWGASDIDLRKQFGFGYRFFGVFVENGKWKKMFRHPILTGGMYFLRFLVGVNYFLKK